jgi:hypothetical protein
MSKHMPEAPIANRSQKGTGEHHEVASACHLDLQRFGSICSGVLGSARCAGTTSTGRRQHVAMLIARPDGATSSSSLAHVPMPVGCSALSFRATFMPARCASSRRLTFLNALNVCRARHGVVDNGGGEGVGGEGEAGHRHLGQKKISHRFSPRVWTFHRQSDLRSAMIDLIGGVRAGLTARAPGRGHALSTASLHSAGPRCRARKRSPGGFRWCPKSPIEAISREIASHGREHYFIRLPLK